MNTFGWKGERVRLVPLERPLHLENALRWLNDTSIVATVEFNWGVTRRQEELFFERIETERESELHWAILDDSDVHVGIISLKSIHWRLRLAEGGILIGERAAWGRGLATDAIRVRTRIAFDELGLHRVEGHTINPAMCRVFEKCGYRREGTQRKKFWRGGRWHDVALYAILDEDHRNREASA